MMKKCELFLFHLINFGILDLDEVLKKYVCA